MSLKTPTEIATEAISALWAERAELDPGKDGANVKAWVAAREKELSVTPDGELRHKGRRLDRDYIGTENLFYDAPRVKVEMTARQLADERALGVRRYSDAVTIVPDPDDDVPPDAADFSIDRAVLLVRGELRARQLPDDDATARAFIKVNSEKLNFSPAGDLRIGNRPLSTELSITPSLLATIATPKVKMNLATYQKLYSTGKAPKIQDVEFV